MMERLDRFVANTVWLSSHPRFRATNLEFFGSDHRLVLLNTEYAYGISDNQGHRPFSFNHHWILEDGYDNLILECWTDDNTAIPLPTKLNHASNAISNLAKIHVGALLKEIKKLHSRISEIRENPTNHTRWDLLGTLEANLEKLLQKEDLLETVCQN